MEGRLDKEKGLIVKYDTLTPLCLGGGEGAHCARADFNELYLLNG